MRKYLKSECPNCGNRLTYSDQAQAEGAYVLDSDQAVKHSDAVTRCDGCGEVLKAGRSEAKSKSKGSARRPQKSKRERSRSSSRSGRSGR